MGLDLGWWFAIFIIGLVIWKEGSRVLAPIIGPIFALVGRAYGATVGNYLAKREATELREVSSPVTALESQVTSVTNVTEVTCDDLDIAWIAYELARGSTPSAVAKQLPGFSPKSYQTFAGKVAEVEALLSEKAAIEQARAARKAAKAQPDRPASATLQEQRM